MAQMHFEKNYAELLVPELVEGDKAKYTLHAASSFAKRAACKGEAFFLPFDKLRDPAKSILRKWFLNNLRHLRSLNHAGSFGTLMTQMHFEKMTQS